jgi:hypothetical protein
MDDDPELLRRARELGVAGATGRIKDNMHSFGSHAGMGMGMGMDGVDDDDSEGEATLDKHEALIDKSEWLKQVDISKGKRGRFTEEEDGVLKENYPQFREMDDCCEVLATMLNERTAGQVKRRLQVLKLWYVQTYMHSIHSMHNMHTYIIYVFNKT